MPIPESWWCFLDNCPSFVCQGPHRTVKTTNGIEVVAYGEEPLGSPVNDDERED